jgi:hypothetical protein
MPHFNPRSTRAATLLLIAVVVADLAPAAAQQLAPLASARAPFTATLSNNTPLAFGMDAQDVTLALGTPLNYVSGRPGDEIFLAFRDIGGSGFFKRKDRLYLQFRHSRLTGWKGDWGNRWIWQ